MRALQIAVVLLVLGISWVEALQCNSCVSQGSTCTGLPEGCEDTSSVCGVVTISGHSISKGCMTMAEVNELSDSDHITVTTCYTDLCN